MLGKIQRGYWKFIGWLYLKHPDVLENIKKIIPTPIKNLVKKALIRDLSRINKRVISVSVNKNPVTVSVYVVGAFMGERISLNNFIRLQTAGFLIASLNYCNSFKEAAVLASKNNTKYSFFTVSGDIFDSTALEKAIIYLETRVDKQFVTFNGCLTGGKNGVGALNVVSQDSTRRSVIRTDFLNRDGIHLSEITSNAYFFTNIWGLGKFIPEKLFAGSSVGEIEFPVIKFDDYEWGGSYGDSKKILKKYYKNLKNNSSSILLSDNPFANLSKITVKHTTKKRVLFVVPWTVIGGSDKVILDLLKKIKESGEFETIMVTTFDVSRHVGENVWEDKFKEYTDYFYPGYAFTDYEHRNMLVKYLIGSFKPDLIVISNSGHGYEAVKNLNLPSLDIHHGDLFMKHATSSDNLINKHVAVSQYVSDLLLSKYGVDNRKIVTIPNGVDENEFNPGKYSVSDIEKIKHGFGISEKDRVLLYVGRLAPEKNPIMLLRALKVLHEKKYSVKVIIVGDGPEKDAMVKYCEHNGLEKCVCFEGFRNNTNDYFAIADVFVLPSFKEAFGIVAIEALMMGIPVVASNIGELPKIIEVGKTGYLANPDDEIDFADKIELAIKNNNNLRKKARSSVVGRYSLAVTSQSYINEMKKLINNTEENNEKNFK